MLQVLGALGCVALVLTLPIGSLIAGIAVFALGICYRAVRHRRTGHQT